MIVIEITKLANRKKKAICIYDTEDERQTRYVIGYINNNEKMFSQALVDASSGKIVYVVSQEDRLE